MNSYIQRWGNSLAIRLPKVFAEETGLELNDQVEITVQDGQIILTPLKSKSYSLDELLAGITPKISITNGTRQQPSAMKRGNTLYVLICTHST